VQLESDSFTLLARVANAAADVGDVPFPRRLRAIADAFAQYQWVDALWSLAVLLSAYALGRVVTHVALRTSAAWVRRTETLIDDSVVAHGSRPLRFLLPALFVRWAMPAVSLPPDIEEGLRHVTLVIAISAAGWLFFGAVRVAEDHLDGRQKESWGPDSLKARALYTQVRSFRNVFGFVIVVVTAAFALMTFEAVRHIGTGLLASAGVAGVVLGVAAQRSIATVLAGIQVALTRPISVDDVVVLEGEWGRIEEVTLTYVIVRLWDLRRLIVPMGYFLEKPFQNWTRMQSGILGNVQLRVDYSVPVDELRVEFARLLKDSPLWDGTVSAVQVTEADERGMVVRLLMSAKDASMAFDLRCDIREKMIAHVRERYPEALPHLLIRVPTTASS
jgi:small-conductance mechanosensitive channel